MSVSVLNVSKYDANRAAQLRSQSLRDSRLLYQQDGLYVT